MRVWPGLDQLIVKCWVFLVSRLQKKDIIVFTDIKSWSGKNKLLSSLFNHSGMLLRIQSEKM